MKPVLTHCEKAFRSNKFAAQLLLNHLFISVIRVIRGLIVFCRERLNDLFEARIGAERIPNRQQLQCAVAQHERRGEALVYLGGVRRWRALSALSSN